MMETLLILGWRTTRLDLSQFVHGKDWAQCYVHATTTVTVQSPSSSTSDKHVVSQPPEGSNLPEHTNLVHLQCDTAKVPAGLDKHPGHVASELNGSKLSPFLYLVSIALALVALIVAYLVPI
jgi:hypothetical protein